MAVYFLDPITGNAETTSQRMKRMKLFHAMCDSLDHHQHLVAACSLGDCARLFALAKEVAVRAGTDQLADSIRDLVTMRLAGETTWYDIAKKVAEVRAATTQSLDPRYQFGDGLLVEYALRAVEVDPEFKTEVALLRKMEKLTVEYAIDQVTKAALRIEGDRKRGRLPKGGLTGLEADVDLGELTAMAARVANGVCRQFLKKGSCAYGRRCKFLHAAPERGGCAECGGPHDVAECPDRAEHSPAADKRAASASSSLPPLGALEARIADLERSLAERAAAAAGAAEHFVDRELAAQLALVERPDPAAIVGRPVR